MKTFTKNTITKGKYRAIIACDDGTFIDDETGEEIELAKELYQKYGSTPFELTASLKVNEEI